MGFLISLLLLIVLRRNELVALSDYQLIMLALFSEAIFALYLIVVKLDLFKHKPE